MATVETILDKIENIKDSKSRIISTLLKNGAEVSQDALLKEIPDVIEEQSIGGGGTALNEHINTLATTNQYGHVRLATSLNDNDTGVVPNMKLLNGDFSSKFVTNDNILGGISTQTILGYDSFSETTTNNTIYLDDDHLVVHSGGNEISFPKKGGTIALTTDITAPSQATKSGYGTVKISSTLTETTDNIVPSISQVNTLLDDKANTSQVFRDTREVAQNASDGIANLFGWSGTLRDLNVNFERVGITTISLKKRTGSAPSNTNYARIVHIGSSGTVEMLFQSKNSVSWGNVAAGTVVTYEMEHIKGRVYPTNTERIVLYFVSSKTDADAIANSNVGLQTESGKGGGLAAGQTSTTSLPGGQDGYRPVIGLTYYNAIDNLESRLIESIETKLDKSHEDKIATHLEYGHIKLGTQYTIDTADDNFGVIGKTSNGQLSYRMDSVPTSGSRLPVKSGGVYQALSEKQDALTAGDNISIENGVISANYTSNISVTTTNSKTLVGNNTTSNSDYSVVIGTSGSVSSGYGTSVGYNSKSIGKSVSIGYKSTASTLEAYDSYAVDGATAIGYNSYAKTAAIAIGYACNAYTGSVSIGGNAKYNYATVIGNGASVSGTDGVSIGRNATAGQGEITISAIGTVSQTVGVGSKIRVATNGITIVHSDGSSQQSVTLTAPTLNKLNTVDTTPTEGSENLVSSGGVKSYIDSIVGDIRTALAAL